MITEGNGFKEINTRKESMISKFERILRILITSHVVVGKYDQSLERFVRRICHHKKIEEQMKIM